MANMNDVITFFLRKGGGKLETVKLQKMVYYANAWHSVWSGKALFPYPMFEAWKSGPVERRAWRTVKDYAREDSGAWFVYTQKPASDPLDLSSYESEVLESVWEKYGTLTSEELTDLSHEETPWRRARGDLPEDARSCAPIDLDVIRNFYAMLQLRSPEKAPRPVKPPREERFRAAYEEAFARHELLFAELAK